MENQDEIIFEEPNESLDAFIPEAQEEQEEEKPKVKKEKKPKEEEDDEEDSSHLHVHRFYPQKFPEVGDVVICLIEEYTDYCAIVSLLEYGQIKATIQFSEFSARRLRETPHKILRVGRKEPLQVLRVDTEKGYIDMTRKNITQDEIQQAFDRHSKGKKAHNIVSHIIDLVREVTISDLYRSVIWPLNEKHSFAYDAFKLSLTDDTIISSLETSDEVKQTLRKLIRHRLANLNMRVNATVEVSCFSMEGVEAVIAALKKGLDTDPKIQITVLSSPQYLVTMPTKDVDGALVTMNSALDKIRSEIESRKGTFTLKQPPTAFAAAI